MPALQQSSGRTRLRLWKSNRRWFQPSFNVVPGISLLAISALSLGSLSVVNSMPPALTSVSVPLASSSLLLPTAAPVLELAPMTVGCDEATSYINSSGNCVHRPEVDGSAPAGATAQCQDGDYSFSQHHTGTCSGHGGVANWL